MLIELHLLQNFAPANLNRDDTGSPKECEFGGYRRARISSQCLKRAIRHAFRSDDLLAAENLSQRSKRFVDHAAEILQRRGRDIDQARQVVETALGGVGIALAEGGKTQYLLFMGQREIDGLVDLCDGAWETLASASVAEDGEKKKGKDAKKDKKQAVPAELANRLKQLFDGGKAADLALFGRMLADLPEHNVDAAAQVAHAISTNRLSQEFDYYTAVDDLKPNDTQGADMLGVVEFNSSCFYRYANVDTAELFKNLGGDRDLVKHTVSAFIKATIRAIPTGKQNSMAAHNPPSLIYAVVRQNGPWSLANAFLNPVRPSRDADLVEASVRALDQYWGRLTAMYGDEGIRAQAVCTLANDGLGNLAGARVDSVKELLATVEGALS